LSTLPLLLLATIFFKKKETVATGLCSCLRLLLLLLLPQPTRPKARGAQKDQIQLS
jgi:hypothetical protein